MTAPERKSFRVVIYGRVQGVFFRSWTVDRAEVRGLDGWVRNRSDGTIEALFAGPAKAVGHMLEACWRGPDYARVTDVQVEPAEDPGPIGFEQRPTL